MIRQHNMMYQEPDAPGGTEAPATDAAPDTSIPAAPPPDDGSKAKLTEYERELAELRKWKVETERSKLSAEEKVKAELDEARQKVADAEVSARKRSRKIGRMLAMSELRSMQAVDPDIVDLLPDDALELDEFEAGLTDKAREAVKRFAKAKPGLFRSDAGQGITTAGGSGGADANKQTWFGKLRSSRRG